MAEILTDENFDKKLAETDKLVMVDFFATWCGPCQVIGPILEKIAEEMKDKIVLYKVNVEEAPMNSQKYGAERIPTIAFFKAGKAVAGFVGLMPEERIKEIINDVLK
jgi:thioredoxin 1